MPGPGNAGRIRAGGASFELSLASGGLEKGLQAIERRVLQFGRSATNSFGRASAAMSTFGRTLTRIGSLGFLGGRGPAGLITGAFAGAGAAAALTYPIRLAANIEVAAAQLAVFTDGFENARNVLLDLQRFSAKAFIPPESLAENAALLLKYGVSMQDAVRSTKALATVSAGSSEELSKLSLAFAQVASTGHLTGEEVRQFKNTAFNPLAEIGERTGETFQQLRKRMEDGRISFDEVADALNRAVGPGGRFAGLLESIAETTIGKFRQAVAQLKLALIPLGDSILPAITQGLTKVSDLLPSLARMLRENTALYKQILIGAIAAAALGTAFVGLGIAATMLASILGLVSVTLGAIFATLGFLMTPLGVLTAGFAALSVQFVRSTSAGQKMTKDLTAGFSSLGQRFMEIFQGIRDALTGNDLQLAGRVLFSGLKVVWLEGVHSLKLVWEELFTDLKGLFRIFQVELAVHITKISSSIELAVHDVINRLKKTVSSFKEVFAELARPGIKVTEFFLKAGSSIQGAVDRVVSDLRTPFNLFGNKKGRAAIDARVAAEHRAIEQQARAAGNIIKNEEQGFRSRLDQQQARRVAEAAKMVQVVQEQLRNALAAQLDADARALMAKKQQVDAELQAAIHEFEKAKAAAAEAARNAGLPAGGLITAGRFPTGRVFDIIAAAAGKSFAEETKQQGVTGLATFDPRLIRQLSGAGEIESRQLRVMQEQLRVQGIIAKQTAGGGFTFTTQP